MKIVIPILILSAAIILTGCLDDPDCNSQTTNFVNIKFYNSDNNEADTLNINGVIASGTDSVFFEEAEVSSIRLPLRPDTVQTTFVFDSELGIDTLILKYSVNTRLVSEDCGIEMVFSELEYVRSDFGSIEVVNKILVEQVTEDVKIFN
ncbi:hypothetical protein GCM10009122_12700 [Fulvivirga kasyanovii]|uniref:Uncharacterized protein n=1 Tax=Fulvivirga kasyanovii TaxID=396812 RepID=A0ABW9RN86_9BACT|nr:DUF6452 family protein [Fulvivirga kasyanovii]MTI25483.1 hypothetical protein [Fulvivirga kasyanovii]